MSKAIIYDDTCPMCRWYTGAFVQYKLLDEENRISFTELENQQLVEAIDLERSRDEIPLIDLQGGPTLYGLDSLLHILGKSFPFIPRLVRIGPINWFFRSLYKLVSYNRRLIVPSKPKAITYDCTPHYNRTYRWIYLALALSVGLGSLFTVADYLQPAIGISLLMTALILLLPAFLFKERKGMDYAGIMATALLIGGLIALPATWWPKTAIVFGPAALLVMIWQVGRRLEGLLLVQQFCQTNSQTRSNRPTVS